MYRSDSNPKQNAIFDHPMFNFALIFYLPSITAYHSGIFWLILIAIILLIYFMAILDYLLMRVISNRNQRSPTATVFSLGCKSFTSSAYTNSYFLRTIASHCSRTSFCGWTRTLLIWSRGRKGKAGALFSWGNHCSGFTCSPHTLSHALTLRSLYSISAATF